MIEQLVQKLFDAAIRNDKECFNSMFEQVFFAAKNSTNLACPRFVARMFCEWTTHLNKEIIVWSIPRMPDGRIRTREHIGTHNFGTNYAIMTEEHEDFNSFVIKKYNTMNKRVESYKITR